MFLFFGVGLSTLPNLHRGSDQSGEGLPLQSDPDRSDEVYLKAKLNLYFSPLLSLFLLSDVRTDETKSGLN